MTARGSRRSDGAGAYVVFFIFAAAVGATVFVGIFENQLSSLSARSAERRLAAATWQAYSGTAAVDLRLACKALAGGDLAGGESRVARAQDKLYAPQLGGQKPVVVARDMEGLERRYVREFKAIRRKRALGRLGQEGAEVTDKAGTAKP